MMGSMLFRMLVFCELFFLASLAIAEDAGMSNYKLGSGDTISIIVYDEKELSIEKTRLSDAGTISLPMLGEIKVLGLTVSELELQVVRGLKQYLVNPKVTVSIEVYRDFFVNGQVYKPGSFPYQPGLTVLKAVAIAGGFKDRASKTHVAIIKDGDDKHTPIKADLGTLVMPGDIITVEESFF